MAKFKCKHTGCVYEWTEEETIANMRKHAEYEEVFAVSPTAPVVAVPAPVVAPEPKPKKVKE